MSTPPWAPRRSLRGASPRLHKYAILAWSVAILCWLAAGILTQVLRGPLALGSDSTTFTPYLGANEQLAFHTNVTSSLASTSLAVLFYGVLAGMWAVLVVFVAKGANWARISQTVLGVIGGMAVLWQVASSLRGSGSGAVLPGWLDLGALLAIAAAILVMYLPASNAYFAGRPPDAPRPARPTRPAVLTRAMWLLAFGAGLRIVGDILHLVLSSGAGPIGSVAGPVVSLAIQAALILYVGRGVNWIRVLLTIVVAFQPVILIQALGWTPAVIVSRVILLVVSVLQVVAIVLLYRPAANEFFRTGAATVQPLRPDQS